MLCLLCTATCVSWCRPNCPTKFAKPSFRFDDISLAHAPSRSPHHSSLTHVHLHTFVCPALIQACRNVRVRFWFSFLAHGFMWVGFFLPFFRCVACLGQSFRMTMPVAHSSRAFSRECCRCSITHFQLRSLPSQWKPSLLRPGPLRKKLGTRH